MSQIIYKGKPYGKQEINLTASLEDPTQLDLTQEQIEGTEPIDLTVDYTNDGSTTNIKMRLPTSLVIANGVIVNENLKQNVWSASEEVTDIVMDQGYRYEYGTSGNRLIWNGVRVLMGKIGTEPTEDSPNQNNLAEIKINNNSDTNYPAYNSADLTLMYWNKRGDASNDVITKILPDNSSKQYIQNFITEEDLYSYIPFFVSSSSTTINNNKNTYIKIVSKTDSEIILSIVASSTLTYFKIPSNATSFGFFIHTHEFSVNGAKVSLGIAAFDNTQTETVEGITRSKLIAFLPFYKYDPLGNTQWSTEYTIPWRTYYKFTPISVLDCYYDNGNVYSDPEKTEVIAFSQNENRMYHDLTTGYYYAIGDDDRLQKMNIVTKISKLEYIGLIDNNPQITKTALSGENSPEFKYAAGITAKYEHITKADYDYLTHITFAELPAPSRSILGNSYVITNAFTTTSNFEGGAGISYPAETSVIVVNTGTDANPVYKYRVITNG